jgi:hypothetical protein
MVNSTRLFRGFAAAFALTAVSTVTIAAPPAISSAVQTGSTVTVRGANFGVKSSPAPFFFQPFTSLSNGATPAAAGFDSWINRGGEAVTMADGVGGGSLRNDPAAADNAFPHVGKYLPANTQEMRLSFYFKLYGNATGARQLKFVRAGVRSGGDGAADYATSDAKFYGSLFISAGNVLGTNSVHIEWRTAEGIITSLYPDESGGGVLGLLLPSQPSVDTSQWVFAEVYYKFNDVGVANGVDRIVLNGYVWHNRTAAQPRTRTDQYIGFVQPIPSMDLPNTAEYDYALSRVYLDVGPQSQAQVFLSNSPTAGGVTKKFILPASTWAADGVTVTNAASIPAGYKYVYVTSVSGETNAAGFELGGVPQPRPPVLNVN